MLTQVKKVVDILKVVLYTQSIDWIMLTVFVHRIHDYCLTRFAHTENEVNHVKNR